MTVTEPDKVKNMTQATVLGLGQLGSAVVAAMIAHGHPTTVWNRSTSRSADIAARGALVAPDVVAAVQASRLVIVVVSDYAAVREVLHSADNSLAGRTVVNLASGTPAQSREMATWVIGHGADYLDAAAMSGTELVGDPDALFLFGGSRGAFADHKATLSALGNAVHLGNDPGLTSLYDTALFGLACSTLAGFYHAVALAGSEGLAPPDMARVAAAHLPFLSRLMTEHARQIAESRYPSHDGTINVHATAMDHLVETSRQHGTALDVPEFLNGLLARALSHGHGESGIARVAEMFNGRVPASDPWIAN